MVWVPPWYNHTHQAFLTCSSGGLPFLPDEHLLFGISSTMFLGISQPLGIQGATMPSAVWPPVTVPSTCYNGNCFHQVSWAPEDHPPVLAKRQCLVPLSSAVSHFPEEKKVRTPGGTRRGPNPLIQRIFQHISGEIRMSPREEGNNSYHRDHIVWSNACNKNTIQGLAKWHSA